MKPIIILAIAAVAAGAMGTGFLNNTNGIDLWIQQFGVGEGDIESPVSHATVDFNIVRTTEGGAFKNIINECLLTFDDDLSSGAHVFCKLTDWAGDIIAEGSTWLMNGHDSHTPLSVPVTDGNRNVLQVKDVIIVVQGGEEDFSEALAQTIAP